jgi:hypothetical protein
MQMNSTREGFSVLMVLLVLSARPATLAIINNSVVVLKYEVDQTRPLVDDTLASDDHKLTGYDK